MIQGTYYKEWSTVLVREMEFKVYGHAGVPVLALPARGGRFYDWENNGMPDAIAQLLNEGKIQLFCADSVDGEGVLNGDLPLRRRAEAQEKYFVYLTAELAPRILTLNKAEKGTKIWCAGVDLGAYQAVNCRLRRPNLFAGAVGMGGIYDLSRFWGVENDDLVLRCSPLLYLQENGIANKLALVKAIYAVSMDIGFLNRSYRSDNPVEVEMNKAKITSFLKSHGGCRKPVSSQNLEELKATLKQLKAIRRKEEV